MYFDALSFLEDERDAWRPFEALGALTDEQLDRPVEAARGWSGRDLAGHLVAWQEHALDVARELAVGEQSPEMDRMEADWKARGDVVNEEIQERWRTRDLDELRASLATVGGELRGTLTVVPEARWVKHAKNLEFFTSETIDHYEEHRPDLDVILAAVR